MPWVPDSRTYGYLGPLNDPPQDDAFGNWLHDVFAGITGLPGDMVRPRWQPEPPNRPEFGVDWMAAGVSERKFDFTPFIGHRDQGDGHDVLQEHEVLTIRCSFYGPSCERYASYLRRGFFVDQNRAECRKAGVGLVDIDAQLSMPEFMEQRWWPRTDLNVILRREIRMDYPVLTILRAMGPIHTETFDNQFDTDRVVRPEFHKEV